MHGFLSIEKLGGRTSRDVVNELQHVVRPSKIGHAGTLDPLATGVLVMAIGHATRFIRHVQAMPKTYVGGFHLGKTSDTEDITGNVVEHIVAAPPTAEEVAHACGRFVGQIQQKPPAFSALKLKGRRAYDLARKGEQVDLPPRPISIHSIELLKYEFPEIQISVQCGSGTYIRSLGRDIGEELGCGAVMSALTRTAIGSFKLEDCQKTDQLKSKEAIAGSLIPIRNAVASLTSTHVSEDQRRALSFGQKIELPADLGEEVVALDGNGNIVAMLARTDRGDYRPAINLI